MSKHPKPPHDGKPGSVSEYTTPQGEHVYTATATVDGKREMLVLRENARGGKDLSVTIKDVTKGFLQDTHTVRYVAEAHKDNIVTSVSKDAAVNDSNPFSSVAQAIGNAMQNDKRVQAANTPESNMIQQAEDAMLGTKLHAAVTQDEFRTIRDSFERVTSAAQHASNEHLRIISVERIDGPSKS